MMIAENPTKTSFIVKFVILRAIEICIILARSNKVLIDLVELYASMSCLLNDIHSKYKDNNDIKTVNVNK